VDARETVASWSTTIGVDLSATVRGSVSSKGVFLLPVRSWNLRVEFRLDRSFASGGDHAPTNLPEKMPAV
jgi:hypothetical protein